MAEGLDSDRRKDIVQRIQCTRCLSDEACSLYSFCQSSVLYTGFAYNKTM